MFLKKAWFTLDCDGGCPAAGHGGVNYIRLFGEDMFDEENPLSVGLIYFLIMLHNIDIEVLYSR